MDKFKEELKELINKHSIENECDMPDFLLSEMICSFIKAIGPKIKKNLDWHGCDSVKPKPDPIVEVFQKWNEVPIPYNKTDEFITDMWRVIAMHAKKILKKKATIDKDDSDFINYNHVY